jgi:hypothetical protein
VGGIGSDCGAFARSWSATTAMDVVGPKVEPRCKRFCRRCKGTGIAPPAHSVAWIMLNPSTADELKLDPTLRRCEGYTHAWGYEGFVVANLFAMRATDPDTLPPSYDAVGLGNEDAIEQVSKNCEIVVCGWGTGAIRNTFRSGAVRHALRAAGEKAHHLGLTKDGHPKHPLYLKSDTKPMEWRKTQKEKQSCQK